MDLIKRPQHIDLKGDFYQILGVSKDATPADIKASYHRLAVKYHPDRNGGELSDEYKAIKTAYDVLIDPERRRIYDETGCARPSRVFREAAKSAILTSLFREAVKHQESLYEFTQRNLAGNLRSLVPKRMKLKQSLTQYEQRLAEFDRLNERVTNESMEFVRGAIESLVIESREAIQQIDEQSEQMREAEQLLKRIFLDDRVDGNTYTQDDRSQGMWAVYTTFVGESST